MFKQYYHQEARYQQSICLNTNVYKPDFSKYERGDRFLTLGIMDEQKGNLEAAILCNHLGLKLDIVGQPFNPEYVKQVEQYCVGDQIKYLGEVSHEEKVRLMQTCKALIYMLKRPEVTSHKIQESMLCGAPIITSRIGALPEIVQHYVDGLLCDNDEGFANALKTIGEWTLGGLYGFNTFPAKRRYEFLKECYSIEYVCKNYELLYKQVAEGLRW